MSDAVLAAIIAATATLCASFLQLRVALAKEADARSRGQPISRRRGRLPMILIGIMLFASAVGGFALAQWLGSSQRTAQADLQRELREHLAELGTAVAALQHLAASTSAAGNVAAPIDAAGDAPALTAATALPQPAATSAATTTATDPPPAESAPPDVSMPRNDAATAPILAQAPSP